MVHLAQFAAAQEESLELATTELECVYETLQMAEERIATLEEALYGQHEHEEDPEEENPEEDHEEEDPEEDPEEAEELAEPEAPEEPVVPAPGTPVPAALVPGTKTSLQRC